MQEKLAFLRTEIKRFKLLIQFIPGNILEHQVNIKDYINHINQIHT